MTVRRRSIRLLLVALVLVVGGVTQAPSASAAEAPVDLGVASGFAVLGGTTVTNTGPTVITGDLGVSPGAAVVGFPPGLVGGTTHAADVLAGQAQAAVVTAYGDAAGRASSGAATDLTGLTLVPGVYTGATQELNGTVTLDGQGDPAAVFVFQSASTLITGVGSNVALVGGAQACNVFWQVGSSATLGVGSTFRGTVLALTAITANTGASVHGRLLARNAAVTLDTNTITASACAAAVVPSPTTTTTPATTSTTTASTTSTTATPSTTTTTVVGTPLDVVAPTTAGGALPAFVAGSGATGTALSSSASGSGSGQMLARTGSALGAYALGGTVAVVIGALLLYASQPKRAAAHVPVHRRRIQP